MLEQKRTESTPEHQPQKPESKLEQRRIILEQLVEQSAKEVNEGARELGLVKPLVTRDMRIDTSKFNNKERYGIYDAEKIKEDSAKTQELLASFSEGYLEEGKEGAHEKALKEYHEVQGRSQAYHAELALTVLLHKILGSRFIVTRSSEFDDFTRGVDTVILDKVTGDVICAFDAVAHSNHESGDPEKKIKKITTSAQKGGTTADYGIAMKEGKLVRAKIEAVPLLYIPINTKDIDSLTNDLRFVKDGRTEDTLHTVTSICSSLDEQIEMLLSVNIHPDTKKKITSLKTSVETMRSVALTKH